MRQPMEAVIQNAVRALVVSVIIPEVTQRVTDMLDTEMRAMIATEVKSAVKSARRSGRPTRPVRQSRQRHNTFDAPGAVWVADRRARRVPKFVIAITKLKTKKAIVAKYGPDVKFVNGKPSPAALKDA